jgi:hypothetical protein
MNRSGVLADMRCVTRFRRPCARRSKFRRNRPTGSSLTRNKGVGVHEARRAYRRSPATVNLQSKNSAGARILESTK